MKNLFYCFTNTLKDSFHIFYMLISTHYRRMFQLYFLLYFFYVNFHLNQSIHLDVGKYQRTILMMKFYHPILQEHRYIISFMDVYSTFQMFAKYQALILKHLLFICNILQLKGIIIAKLGLSCQAVLAYSCYFIHSLNLHHQ